RIMKRYGIPQPDILITSLGTEICYAPRLTQAVLAMIGVEGELVRRLAGLGMLSVITLIVLSGLRLSAWLWTGLTILKLAPLLLLIVAWWAYTGPTVSPAPAVPGVGWLRAGLVAMFACQGFEVVPVIAGQVRSSARAVPRATVGSLVLSVTLYVGLAWACVVALPDLAASATPLVDAAGVLGGARLSTIVYLGTSISAFGICFGMIVTTPRYLSSMAAGAGGLFGLDRVAADGVPRRALAVTWILVAVFLGVGELGELFALSSLTVLMQFGVTAAALLALALRGEHGLRPRDAWPAPLTLLVAVTLAGFGATAREGVVALGAVLVGVAVLRLARRSRPVPPRAGHAGRQTPERKNSGRRTDPDAPACGRQIQSQKLPVRGRPAWRRGVCGQRAVEKPRSLDSPRRQGIQHELCRRQETRQARSGWNRW
ncbi:MAG: amino acid permease, partial [Desulfobulbaceae bacterium]|nr:amino acid permease [Desulfobulbaceae bacterium]